MEITLPFTRNDSIPLKSLKDFIEKNKDTTTFLEHKVKGFLKGIGLFDKEYLQYYFQ